MRYTILTLLTASLVSAWACSSEPRHHNDDDENSDGGGGSGASSGDGGSGNGSSSGGFGGGCEGLCDKVAEAACPNDTKESCLTECEGLYTQAPSCTAELDAVVACQIESGTVNCVDGDAKIEGCDAEETAVTTCILGGGSTGACYAGGGECNPMTDSCGPGQSCDIAGNDNLFHCFPPPNDAPLGGACDAASGPYCQHGTACVQGFCRAYCCASTDCTSGTCQPFGSGATFALMACM